MLGRNLSIHPAMGMYGLFDQQMEPWNAIPQSYGVDDLVDDRVRFEGFYVPPPIGGALLPVEGAELTRWMDAQDRVGQFGFMVRDRGVGRVLSGPGRRPIIRYDLDAATLRRFRTGAARLAELLLQGGAREVLAGVGPVKSVRSVEEARAIEHRGLRPRDFRLLAFHPLGTCRMGVDADRGVVDTEHRVHGMQGLYVADGSSVPSSLGVNPQVTIMAMAARAAEGIAARLG